MGQDIIKAALANIREEANLNEACKKFLDSMGIGYTSISPAVLPADAFFDNNQANIDNDIIKWINEISIVGITSSQESEVAVYAIDLAKDLSCSKLSSLTRAFNRAMPASSCNSNF